MIPLHYARCVNMFAAHLSGEYECVKVHGGFLDVQKVFVQQAIFQIFYDLGSARFSFRMIGLPFTVEHRMRYAHVHN